MTKTERVIAKDRNFIITYDPDYVFKEGETVAIERYNGELNGYYQMYIIGHRFHNEIFLTPIGYICFDAGSSRDVSMLKIGEEFNYNERSTNVVELDEYYIPKVKTLKVEGF